MSRAHLIALANAAVLAAFALGRPALAAERPLHQFASLVLSPDARYVAALESDEAAGSNREAASHLIVRPLDGGPPRRIPLPCESIPRCAASAPAWSPDGRELVFILRDPRSPLRSLYSTKIRTKRTLKLLNFRGALNEPRYLADGSGWSVLATAGARKEIGATQAGAPVVGEIGTSADEQRIATLTRDGRLHFISPPDFFVYEYDRVPAGFVATAARGNGDNNWWIAKLYFFGDDGSSREIYAPPTRQQQLAEPHASPDGTSVAFVGGLMSDFGLTGGDIFVVPVAGGAARNVTPNLDASATSLEWACPQDAAGRIAFTALAGDTYREESVAAGGGGAPTLERSHPGRQLSANGRTRVARACGAAGTTSVSVRQGFEIPPEIWLRRGASERSLSASNTGLRFPGSAQAVEWKNDGWTLTGWLLAPTEIDASHKHPLIVDVHGGPTGASGPRFITRGTTLEFLRRGWYVFAPNPRGSLGHGESFARANVKDFGGGDLRDILSGVDAVERMAPIDDARLGITGHSYGGYMTMWAVTQTTRFKAAVAGAGVADWRSYYGQNGIDQWMLPFFDASYYDDPAVYEKSSPIAFIKNARTPTFAYVGERDVEVPAAQSLEFWHALSTLGIPAELVIYPGEGHAIRRSANTRDAERRTLDWFARYFK